MDDETKFYLGLLELQYGKDVKKKLSTLAKKVDWAKGWPEDTRAFWNAESFMWGHKIDRKKRELITKELSSLKGKNLDLGCGAYSYLPSIGFDVSERMLQMNDLCKKKIVGDLEKKLPFRRKFDSVTAIFVLSYVKEFTSLLAEIKRVLRKKGQFVMVQSAKEINDWQRQKELNHFSAKKWKNELENAGFLVENYRKSNLLFFSCRKA